MAEFLLLLLGACIVLVIYVFKSKSASSEPETPQLDEAEKQINPGTSYSEYIEQEQLRNEIKTSQQARIESEEITENEQPTEDNIENLSQAPNEQQSELLNARHLFLDVERQAAEHSENDITFWETLYGGMQKVLEQLKTSEIVYTETTEEHEPVHTQTETREKIFYIEAQGKNIDGEVTKLKDIVFEQENSLNSLRKALKNAEGVSPDIAEQLTELFSQIDNFERQLNDSKMCIEVLEMENDKLQKEVGKLEKRHSELFEQDGEKETETDSEAEASSMIDLAEMKEVLDKQEQQINELLTTIDNLSLEAEQAEKLKATIHDFTRTSHEMMGCISILEEDNERLKEQLSHVGVTSPEDESNGDTEQLQSQISTLEEDLIKKDVAYAQLQDEFNSMEKEYLSMYEALHGD
ncbi:MAG: hypothetical protein OQL06_03560 [Gammaproteobacteria bacterium]|nr:hypothetical protein [Gammaproteobacteria bacterium]